jgi:hypothetical protein
MVPVQLRKGELKMLISTESLSFDFPLFPQPRLQLGFLECKLAPSSPDKHVMHGQVLSVLFECSVAAEIAIAAQSWLAAGLCKPENFAD